MKIKNRVLPPYQSATTGDAVKFKCVSDVIPIWSKEGLYFDSNLRSGRIYGTDVYWLEIESITLDDAGIYTCESEENNFILYDEGVLDVICKHNITFMCQYNRASEASPYHTCIEIWCIIHLKCNCQK